MERRRQSLCGARRILLLHTPVAWRLVRQQHRQGPAARVLGSAPAAFSLSCVVLGVRQTLYATVSSSVK